MNLKFLPKRLSGSLLAMMLLLGGSAYAAVPVIEDIDPAIIKSGDITQVAVTTSDEDAEADLIISVTDADGNPVTGITTAWLPWTGGGEHALAIDASVVGSGVYTVTVTDSEGLSASKTLDLTVVDPAEGESMASYAWEGIANKDEEATFQLTFDAVPHGNNLDAAVALSGAVAAPNAWGDLSAIIRFTYGGTFDARNGSAYAADATLAYESGVKYSFVVDVDVANQTYSVSITPDGGTATVIATDYAFRAEATAINTIMLPSVVRAYTISNIQGMLPAPVLEDIDPLLIKEGVTTNFDITSSDADGTEDALVVSVTDAEGNDVLTAEGGFSTAWSPWTAGGQHLVYVDGTIVTEGTYNVIVTDTDGSSATKPVEITVDSTPARMSSYSWEGLSATDETGTFSLEFDAVPHNNHIDAAIALSDAVATPNVWDDLSAIIRFGYNGTFDARNGGAYAADATVAYEAGKRYHFIVDVDVAAETYSVAISPAGASDTTVIATDYGFRKTGVTAINTLMLPATVRSYTISNIQGMDFSGEALSGGMIEIPEDSLFTVYSERYVPPYLNADLALGGTQPYKYEWAYSRNGAEYTWLTSNPNDPTNFILSAGTFSSYGYSAGDTLRIIRRVTDDNGDVAYSNEFLFDVWVENYYPGEIGNNGQTEAAPTDNVNKYESIELPLEGAPEYTYDWEYNKNDEGWIALGIATVDFDLSAGTFASYGYADGDNLKIRRVVIDGLGTVRYSNVIEINIKDAVSVHDELAASIKMYPNPANGVVNISAEEFSSIEIYNSLGQYVLSLEGGRDITLNTAKLQSGLYIVRFVSEGNSVAKQLMIK